MLEVHEHGHAELLRDLGHGPDVLGVACHLELLFGDDHGTGFQKFLELLLHARQVGHFVGTEEVFLGKFFRDL